MYADKYNNLNVTENSRRNSSDINEHDHPNKSERQVKKYKTDEILKIIKKDSNVKEWYRI